MTTLQDILNETDRLYPWNNFETRDIRSEIITEIFCVSQESKEWNKILIKEDNRDLNDVIQKHFKNKNLDCIGKI